MDAGKNIRYLAEYLIFCTLLFAVRCLPVATSVRSANGLAWMLFRFAPRKATRYQVARDNIATAFGETVSDAQADRMILGMWQHLARMVFEIIQMDRRLRLYNCTQHIDFYQRSLAVKALMQDRPVILLGGHFGNWEVSINTFGDFGMPMGVVGRDLDNPWLHQWFRNVRESKGNWLISKAGASSELVTSMERRESVSLLADQDAGRRGVFVDFFGRPASTFKSIALLALQHDGLIVVGGAYRLPESEQNSCWVRFNMATEAVIDSRDFDTADGVTRLTQAYTTAIEQLVRKAPAQYFWIHRRWKSEPRKKRARTRKSAA